MGLLVSVYRTGSYDCTNGGISSMFSTLCLTNVNGPFDPDDTAPAALLVAGHAPGTVRIIGADNGKQWSMMGGNYAATSDSRFNEHVEKLTGAPFYGAVPIHDRFE